MHPVHIAKVWKTCGFQNLFQCLKIIVMDPKVLQDCAQRLIETAQTIRSYMGTSGNSAAAANQGNVQASSTTTTNSTCQPCQPAATSNLRSNSSVISSALSEHNRIFGYRPPSAVSRSKPGKRSGTTVGSRPKYFKPSATWSRAFICLAEKGQNHAPSTTERISLLLAGLGEKKIQFPSEGNAAEVHESIMEAFPCLENGGGYEILRSGDGRQKELLLIPMPTTGFSVSYLKSVLGQAKGYLRPLQKDIYKDTTQDDDKSGESSNCPTVKCVNCSVMIPMNGIRDHQSVCGGGSSQSVHDDHEQSNEDQTKTNDNKGSALLEDLMQLFPNIPVDQIENALTDAKGDSNQAANMIMTEKNQADKFVVDNEDSDEELMQSVWNILGVRSNKENNTSNASINDKDISLSSIINKLGRKLTGQEVKIQIDQRNVLLDALPIYKNPDFNATCPLRVSFSEQPAVDIGGPKREFFTRLFEEIAGGSGGSVPNLFEGPEGRLMPVYSSSILYSGIMTAVGKMIAHSIAQCGVGFPYLSPLCYWYLVTADVQKAIGYANVTDIRDFEVSDLVKRLLNAKVEDLAALKDDPSVIAILSDAGCNERPSMDNRQLLVESVMLHTTLSKRKVILDQLRKGLECLNVLGEMTERPLLFQGLFIASAEDVNPSKVMGCLTFSGEHASCSSKSYLQQFIEESTKKDLQSLLSFTTGSTAIPLGPGKISISFDALDGTIFASTCLLELHMPPSFSSYEEFKAALSAATAVDPVQYFNSI